jgi:hypothetical protein
MKMPHSGEKNQQQIPHPRNSCPGCLAKKSRFRLSKYLKIKRILSLTFRENAL